MRRWAAAVAVVLGATACSSPGERPAAAEGSADLLPTVRDAAEPVPGMAGEAVQLRTDAAVGGRIQVRITASDTFTVTSVALDSPGFAPLPPRELSADFVPGRVIDLRTRFGSAQCDVGPEPASAQLTVVRPGGRPEQVELPLAAAVLQRIHAAECTARALAEEATVEVADLREDGDGLAGSLVLVRHAGEREVHVVALRRSVLMAVEVDLPLTMAPDASEASTEVRFTPASCEPHVLAETKQPYLFKLAVQVGDADPVTIDLSVPDDVRAELQALVRRVCG